MVRRLAAEEEYEGTFQLRLMPQPIHRYTDAKIGVIDGTIFVMAHGTNVELLVFVEAQETKDKPQWFVGFSRLGAAALQARFDNETIWAAERNFGGASSSYGNFAEPMNAEELQLFLNSEP